MATDIRKRFKITTETLLQPEGVTTTKVCHQIQRWDQELISPGAPAAESGVSYVVFSENTGAVL